MEVIGDSTLIVGDEVTNPSDTESIEFERNLEIFTKSLENEESRLVKLEEQRLKIQQEIETMFGEITEEKKKYRKAIDNVIDEQEKVSRDFLESCHFPTELSPIASSMSLLEDCASSIEATKNLDFNIELDIENIRCELMKNYISTKEDYLSTMKEHFLLKRKKTLELQSEAEAVGDSS